ncbi:helix-turn-helix transcriptional regulator [Cryobacterium sp. SO2]|uniref:helix-turn-helix domain-containing protein n=1 Tax=Cryobacterium sp. SO2 TaxID=1897060 RepID=UPI00223CAACC|nr:helix-turn-helix transcriptional regulator [Cryobacterium sp. SO2]WEO77211.1 helix-turn-helix transcriptional regulator [Cryobacterium sp. SO2]
MTENRREFGALLRTWRDHTSPAAVGLFGGSRRTTGLRREELAALAGLSVDYVIRLEQGRTVHPSAQVVAALARALRLSDDDAAVFHQAAGLAAPVGAISHLIPAGVERLLLRTTDAPVAVFSADWWLLSWNNHWAALLGDPAALTGRDRNLIWRDFTGDFSRVVKTDAERDSFRDTLVADLRIAAIEHPTDTNLHALVADLISHSADFSARWSAARPARHESNRKTIDHPRVGALTLDCDVLNAPGSDVHVVMYTAAPGSDDASRLDLLKVLGVEAFTT